jgi:hypothetical protein
MAKVGRETVKTEEGAGGRMLADIELTRSFGVVKSGVLC